MRLKYTISSTKGKNNINCYILLYITILVKQVSTAYLPHLCALGFQAKFASAGFSPGTPVFFLHLQLDQTGIKFDPRALLESSDTYLSKASLSKYGLFIMGILATKSY